MKGEAVPQGPYGAAQGRPFGPRALKQAHFVFFEEDEIAVRICSEIAFGCSLAKSSERFQSALVIVLKSGSDWRARED